MTAKQSTSFRPSLEPLEDRTVLASGLKATLSQGVLTIMGTNYADTIRVRQHGSQVTIDGFRDSIDVSRIKKIAINAGGGNDKVEVNLSPQMTVKTFVNGGTGTDSLTYPQGTKFGAVQGLERYYYGPGATGQTGGSTGGSTGGTTNGQNQKPGWYFETKSGMVGGANEQFGPYQSRQDAESALRRRLEIFQGDRRAITRDVYYFDGKSSGSTGGNTNPGNGSGSTAKRLPAIPSWFRDNGASVPYRELGLAVRLITGNPFAGYTAEMLGWAYKQYLDKTYGAAFRMHDWLYSKAYQNEVSAGRERVWIGMQDADKLLRDTIAAGGSAADKLHAKIVYHAISIGGVFFYGKS